MGEGGIICLMASKNDEEVVRRAPLFTALDDAASATLRASMSGIKISKGQILFKEGDAGDRLFVVVEGKLKLGTSSGDGRENLLSILGPGDMFGELSLFDPGPRTATATAVVDSRLLTLANDQVIGWVTAHPRFHCNYWVALPSAYEKQMMFYLI